MAVQLCSWVLDEALVPLTKAGKRIPGRGVSPACIERWIRKGVNGVTLEICRIGRERYTSQEAIRRFLDAMNRNPGAPIVTEPMGPIRTPEETKRQLSELFGPKKRGPKPTAERGADE